LRFKTRYFAYPYLLWMVIFTIAPIALIVYYAFTNVNGQLTFGNILSAMGPEYMKVLGRSLLLATECTVICLLLAYPAAFILSKMKNGGVLSMLFMLPMWMNFLLRTYAWMTLLENTGLINSLLSAMGLNTVTFLYNSNAVLLDGCCIRRGSVVGAGALVTQGKDFPEHSLIIGSPAKAVRELPPESEAERIAHADGYLKLALSYDEEK